MGLDLVSIAERMPDLVTRLRDEHARHGLRLGEASGLLARVARRPVEWRARLEAAETRWPLALPLSEAVDAGYPAPAAPAAYGALAVDGSHIDVDRNAAAPCYVLNLGWAAIFYGGDLPAVLDSRAELELPSSGAAGRDEEDASSEEQVRGEVLSLLRSVRELAGLAALAQGLPAGLPQAVLLDGNLGLWNVSQAGISRRLRERLIEGEDGLRPSLDALRALARERTLAFGAYTSAAGTSDVIHALRVAACPLDDVRCTHCPGLREPERPCDAVGLPSDADLFRAVLAPGERSAVFETRSRAFLRRSGSSEPAWYEAAGHTVGFFYLRVPGATATVRLSDPESAERITLTTAGEIARVELPLWAARERERVDLLHAILLDQCAKGPQYPIVLQEAHEQAVITTVDRRSFAALLEREIERSGLLAGGSAKAQSKRTRTL